MSEYSQIVCDLLEARRSEPSATEGFMKLKHDKDLCPGFQKQSRESLVPSRDTIMLVTTYKD
jgi:hypothetical protein